MRNSLIAASAVVPLVFLSGCPAPQSQTTVQLINDADHPVDVQLFYDDDQNLTEGLIELDGIERNFIVQPGETQAFSEDCEALQAIFIKDAELRVIAGVSPEASTDVYREPDDFGCGDTLRFRFTQNALATELDISFGQSN